MSVHSAMKSASTWDLMALRGAYVRVLPMSSTDHLAILPMASWFWMISPSRKDETTVTGWLLVFITHYRRIKEIICKRTDIPK